MKILTIIILILFAAIGILGFWYWQTNIYSKEVLKLEILGPEKVPAGQQVEYIVKFKNNGKTRLENPELIFEAPEKSILEDHNNLRVTQKIEDIYPGEERTYSFNARLFGREEETFEAKAWLSYQPKNLQAVYESKTTFTSRINFIPLTFEFDLAPKVEAGEEINFSLNYFSNIDYLLENIRIRAYYPDGFDFESSLPNALDQTEWSLPSLFRASGGRVEITGLLDGKEGESKVFKAELGIVKDGGFWLLKQASESVQIAEPSLYVSYMINGSQEYSAQAGELLHYEIFFKNIGRKPVQKKFLIARLQGDFFDFDTLRSDNGEFGQGDSAILWDWKNIPSLRFLDAGEEGRIEFWIRLKQEIGSQINKPRLDVRINLAGIEKVFQTKVNSEIILSQKAYFNQEFFDNAGPLPPQVGESTEYVILWQIKNTWNDLENVKIKAVLPSNVKPTGKIFPEDAKFTYDSGSREAVWTVEDAPAWTGYDNELITLAFQVELVPKSSQKGRYAELIEDAEISCQDKWTGDTISGQAESRNTSLPDDDTTTKSDGKVE